MEESVTASRLNLLDNADFTNGMTCWNPNYDRIAIGTNADADKPSYLSNHVMCMVGGGPGSALRVYQDLPLIGKKGTVFVAGGWSRAQSVPRNGHPERYRMQVQFHSASTGCMDAANVLWSEEWSGWHMAAAPAVAPCDFTTVRVSLDYQGNYLKCPLFYLVKSDLSPNLIIAYHSLGKLIRVQLNYTIGENNFSILQRPMLESNIEAVVSNTESVTSPAGDIIVWESNNKYRGMCISDGWIVNILFDGTRSDAIELFKSLHMLINTY